VYYCYHDLDIQEKCDHLIEEIRSYVDNEETLYLTILNFRYTHFYSLKRGKGVGVGCRAFTSSCISAEFSVFNSLSRQTLGQWSGLYTYSLEVPCMPCGHWASVMQSPFSQIGASDGQMQPGSRASEHTGVGFAHVLTHPGWAFKLHSRPPVHSEHHTTTSHNKFSNLVSS